MATTGDCTVVYNDKAIEDFLEMFELCQELTTSCSPSSNSNSMMFNDFPGTQIEQDANQQSSLKLASDPCHHTPKIKKNGILNQPVRRRLFLTEENDHGNGVSHYEEGSSKIVKRSKSKNAKKENIAEFPKKHKIKRSTHGIVKGCYDDGGSKASPPNKKKNLHENKNQNLSHNFEKVVHIGTNRKIAQLVVWTKNCAKLEDKEGDQRLESTEPQEVLKSDEPTNTVQTRSAKDFNPESDLFFVHYPVRPAYEVSKNKVKANKRQRIPSPIPVFLQKRKRSTDGLNTSEINLSKESSSDDSCLVDDQCLTSNITIHNADFRVEKLFQPEPETVPQTEGISETFPAFEVPLPEPESHQQSSVVSINPSESESCSEEGVQVCKADASQKKVPELEVPISTIGNKEVNNRRSEGETCFEPEPVSDSPYKGTVEGAIEHNELPPFTLPDEFTVVTSAAPNEFDLLIQNVVHEELVDGIEDDVGLESFAKKMKLNNGSNCSSKSSSQQEGLAMDEAGKPRCTYTELIEKALTETGGLTVSEIYSWISERYPFYKPDDDRWKNSVRHNLSINPYFKKGDKARSGAGHLWTISEESKGLRPSMVSGDEVSFGCDRRKCPYDPSEFSMPMESETDRAVANILGRYASECRANQEATKNEKKEDKDKLNQTINVEQNDQPLVGDEGSHEGTFAVDTNSLETVSENANNVSQDQEGCPQALQPEYNSSGVIRDSEAMPQFNINELNSGQFTVDLSGITIPEGGSINFEDLVNNGRLIYIQTDFEANKENESTQTIILNENLIPELSGLANGTTNVNVVSQNNDERYQSFYSDSLGLDLGFGKGDSISNVSFPQDDILAAACAHLISDESQQQEHQQNLTTLDQVCPLPSYSVTTTSANDGITGSGLPETLPSIDTAALYESRELGISYTYQAESNEHDLLQ